jgi:murein DD-endopeptidase MepM/ murein hydrolase activator NlpD
MMPVNKSPHFTFMVVPHGSSKKIISFQLKFSTVVALGCVAALAVVLTASSFVYSTMLSRKLIQYNMLLAANQSQKNQLAYFSLEATQLREAVNELAERDSELRKLLGLKEPAAGNRSYAVVVSDERKSLDALNGAELGSIYGNFRRAEVEIARRKESLAHLQQTVSQIRKNFAQTPSIWPTHGSLASGFGYRYFPWRGFHAGVDISTWYGAPVRSTAAGVVAFVGWRSGYGRTVIVDHGGGVTTLYAHNSSFATKVGERVIKGQVIAYVGTSGLSTGPHCHYEIRRNDRPINPVAYLGTDLFTASKNLNQ